ncbi:MAG: beta-galactosidase, partial [Clostridia bacterium]
PPKIPANIPVSIYRKTFEIAELEQTRILTFLGAAATLEVYMNGSFVGYSEGSHNTAEFDISQCAVKGVNELVVVVHKWCNGSYLECQDMFRENGIFRDVFITSFAKSYVFDYEFDCKYVNGYYDFDATICVKNAVEGCEVLLELVDADGKIVAQKKQNVDGENVDFKFENLQVKDWSAELPCLYTLNICLVDADKTKQFVRALYGFKRIE